MKLSLNKILLSLLALGVVELSYADEGQTSSNTTTVASDSPWSFVVAPYVWGLNMNGNVKIGDYNAPVSETFGDIIQQLNYGGMLYLGANKGKWGAFLDSLYAVTSDNTNDGPYSIKLTNKFGLFTLAGSYRAFEKSFEDSSSIAISPYLGARYTFDNATLKASLGSFETSVSNNHNWIDPIVGARMDYHFNPQWSTSAYADGGSGDFSRDYTYRFAGFVGYKPESLKMATIYGGYQYLKEKYTTGSGSDAFTWNMKLFGPVVGLAFVF